MANFNIDYLVVAGGGAGGRVGGGGGAGGYRTSFGTGNINGGNTAIETPLSLSTSTNYNITIGAGGSATTTVNGQSGSGTSSSISALVQSTGGGGAGNYATGNGASGGSGGGGASSGTQQSGGARVSNPIQGFVGGSSLTSAPYPAGGGGGASSSGGNGTGGSAMSSLITGTSTSYAGGGGGGNQSSYYGGSASTSGGGGGAGNGSGSSTAGSSAVNNTGSGGGGGGFDGANGIGGNGGSGVVILRYATADVAGYTVTGAAPTETTDGADTVLSFTTVGTGSITFTAPTPPPPTPTFDGTKVTTPVTGFESGVDIGLKIPVGTNSNLPTGVEGMIRNDTEEVSGGTNSTTAITFYNGTDWKYFNSTESPDSPPIENFNTVTYDGNSGIKEINTVGFQPDLVWIKRRNSSSYNHVIRDSVRGTDSVLSSNTNGGEVLASNRFEFLNNGFKHLAGTQGSNNSNGTYVAWCFKAGGAAVSNTDGDIASNVSVNNDLGFSVVSYNGSGTIGDTVGHGLNTTPEFIIIKNLSSSVNWSVYHKDIGSSKKLQLHTTSAEITSGNYANTNPTNSVISLSGGNEVNGNVNSYIAYCFASKIGVSKVGDYVGNGNTTGPIVTLGFEPAWLMFKCTTQPGNWIIIDNKRATSNPRTPHLRANSTAQDDFGANEYVDFTSTGFQPKGVSNYNNNSTGQTYIYLAFAT